MLSCYHKKEERRNKTKYATTAMACINNEDRWWWYQNQLKPLEVKSAPPPWQPLSAVLLDGNHYLYFVRLYQLLYQQQFVLQFLMTDEEASKAGRKCLHTKSSIFKSKENHLDAIIVHAVS